MTKGRLEAFSDGVFAIAITLLVLEIRVPDGAPDGPALAHALADQWWSYAAYALSFVVIGIMWVNHHTLFDHVRIVDRPLTMLNLLLLGLVALVPWPTHLVARYVGENRGAATVAMVVYSALSVALAIAFNAIWWWMTRGPQLLRADQDYRVLRKTRARWAVGLYVYLGVLVVAFFAPLVALVAQGAVAVYYIANQLATAPAGDGPEEEDASRGPDIVAAFPPE